MACLEVRPRPPPPPNCVMFCCCPFSRNSTWGSLTEGRTHSACAVPAGIWRSVVRLKGTKGELAAIGGPHPCFFCCRIDPGSRWMNRTGAFCSGAGEAAAAAAGAAAAEACEAAGASRLPGCRATKSLFGRRFFERVCPVLEGKPQGTPKSGLGSSRVFPMFLDIW